MFGLAWSMCRYLTMFSSPSAEAKCRAVWPSDCQIIKIQSFQKIRKKIPLFKNYIDCIDWTALIVEQPKKFNISSPCGRVKGRLGFGPIGGLHLDIGVHVEQLFGDVQVAHFDGYVHR